MKKITIIVFIILIIAGVIVWFFLRPPRHPREFYSKANRMIIQTRDQNDLNQGKYKEIKDRQWINQFLSVIKLTGEKARSCECFGETQFILYENDNKLGMICLYKNRIRCYGMKKAGDLEITNQTYEKINNMLSEVKDWKYYDE